MYSPSETSAWGSVEVKKATRALWIIRKEIGSKANACYARALILGVYVLCALCVIPVHPIWERSSIRREEQMNRGTEHLLVERRITEQDSEACKSLSDGDMTQISKVLSSKERTVRSCPLVNTVQNTWRRGCQTAISGSRFKTTRRKCFFIQEIIKLWKSLTRMLWVFILRDKWIQKAIR